MTAQPSVLPFTDAMFGTSKAELLTPALAQALLEGMPANRHVSQQAVDKFARDMSAGMWQVNGESIKIDTDGNLIDGQHRCWAIIQSGVSVWTYIARGLPPEARGTVDSGRKRSVADVLLMEGVPNSGTLSSLSRRMIRWNHGWHMIGGGQVQPSSSEQHQWIEDNEPACHSWASFGAGNQHKVGVSAGTLATAFALLSGADASRAGEFMGRLSDGMNLGPGHPVLALRARLFRDPGLSRTDIQKADDQLAAIISAWNAYRRGRTMLKVQLPTGGLSNTSFPSPR